MPTSSQLPIYNDLMLILKDLYQRVPKFSKQYKYLLGEKMLECPVNAFMAVRQASETRERSERILHVTNLQYELGKLLIYVRLANELNQLGNAKAYLYVSENVVKVLDQARNWKKSLQKKS